MTDGKYECDFCSKDISDGVSLRGCEKYDYCMCKCCSSEHFDGRPPELIMPGALQQLESSGGCGELPRAPPAVLDSKKLHIFDILRGHGPMWWGSVAGFGQSICCLLTR